MTFAKISRGEPVYAKIRRGWALSSDEFRKELLEAVKVFAPNPEHHTDQSGKVYNIQDPKGLSRP